METLLTTLITGILVPLLGLITAPIPILASSGTLLIVFAGLWLAFAIALVRKPDQAAEAWPRLRSTPLIVQALAWLLFLPVVAGMWVWHTGWPRIARLLLVTGLAGWNLVVFLPAG